MSTDLKVKTIGDYIVETLKWVLHRTKQSALPPFLSSMGYVLFVIGSSYGGTKLLGGGRGGINFHFNLKLAKC